jgi:hypothetical protein
VLTVELPDQTGMFDATIIDVLGRPRLSYKVQSTGTIDLSSFDQGIYFLKVTDENAQGVVSFMLN